MKNKIKELRELREKYLHHNHLAKYFEDKYNEVASLYEQFKTTFAPGHFYSPYPDMEEIEPRRSKIFDRTERNMPGIDMRKKEQLYLLQKLAKHYKKLPYRGEGEDSSLRYKFGLHNFSYTDASVLFCMFLELKPNKVIEIGSGYSSALMLDTNELFFNNTIDYTFIEPYPELLLSLTKPQDSRQINIVDKKLFEVNEGLFGKLEAGDVLFIDSTHVSKVGSDVNQLFFSIIPNLKKGVIIHIHDVFYPFEYPEEWIDEGRAWNEDYLLRAFLFNNKDYEILFFNHYMNLHHKASFEEAMPLTKNNTGGSIWLKKVK